MQGGRCGSDPFLDAAKLVEYIKKARAGHRRAVSGISNGHGELLHVPTIKKEAHERLRSFVLLYTNEVCASLFFSLP